MLALGLHSFALHLTYLCAPAVGVVCARATASQHLALLCLGEIGRRSDLSGVSGVDAAINTALSSDSEDVKSAASLALGGVACGNLGKYLPALLQSIQVCVAHTWGGQGLGQVPSSTAAEHPGVCCGYMGWAGVRGQGSGNEQLPAWHWLGRQSGQV
jgi:hypothetical protein